MHRMTCRSFDVTVEPSTQETDVSLKQNHFLRESLTLATTRELPCRRKSDTVAKSVKFSPLKLMLASREIGDGIGFPQVLYFPTRRVSTIWCNQKLILLLQLASLSFVTPTIKKQKGVGIWPTRTQAPVNQSDLLLTFHHRCILFEKRDHFCNWRSR